MPVHDRHPFVIGVAVILKKDNKILLEQRKNTGWQDGNWTLPGGGLEHGESVFYRAAQEAKEELDVIIDEKDLKVIHLLHLQDEVYKGMTVFLEANRWQGVPKVMEKDKCAQFGWFSYDEFPENLAPSFSLVLKNLSNNKIFTSHGFKEIK